MTHEPVDPEVVAALLDGTLPAAERDEALERLARSPGDFEAFAEAARILRDLEGEEEEGEADAAPPRPAAPDPTPLPLSKPAHRRFSGPKLWLPIAAGLAGALLLPRLLRNPDQGVPLGLLDGAALVASPGDGSLEAALGPEWDQPGWSVRRGGEVSLAEQRRAFRIGVRLADLEAALDAADGQGVARVAPEFLSLVGQIRASGAVVAQYEDIRAQAVRAGSPGRLDTERERAAAGLGSLLSDSPWFEVGVWAGQARLATLSKHWEFFDDRAARALRGLTERVARNQGEQGPLAQRFRQLYDLVGDGVSREESAQVEAALAHLMREGGG